MYQNANYLNHFGSVKADCKPETLVTDTVIISMIHLGMLRLLMHDKNLIPPVKNIAVCFPTPSTLFTFYVNSLDVYQ